MAVNRRLDEWVKLDQLDLDSVEAVVDEKVEEKVLLYLEISQFHLFWTSSTTFFSLRMDMEVLPASVLCSTLTKSFSLWMTI